MSEYIDREAAIEICETEYQARLRMCDYCGDTVAWNIGDEIKALPAADVAPVVHCRHCRSYNKPRLGWCSVHLDREGPDDFCGYGARMGGDDDAKEN